MGIGGDGFLRPASDRIELNSNQVSAGELFGKRLCDAGEDCCGQLENIAGLLCPVMTPCDDRKPIRQLNQCHVIENCCINAPSASIGQITCRAGLRFNRDPQTKVKGSAGG